MKKTMCIFTLSMLVGCVLNLYGYSGEESYLSKDELSVNWKGLSDAHKANSAYSLYTKILSVINNASDTNGRLLPKVNFDNILDFNGDYLPALALVKTQCRSQSRKPST